MTKEKQDSFFYKVGELENLVQRQQKALEMANELLELKDKLVDLCEEEVEFYKAENKRLRRSLIIFGVVILLNLIVDLVSLAY
jgi:hypothetical protein